MRKFGLALQSRQAINIPRQGQGVKQTLRTASRSVSFGPTCAAAAIFTNGWRAPFETLAPCPSFGSRSPNSDIHSTTFNELDAYRRTYGFWSGADVGNSAPKNAT